MAFEILTPNMNLPEPGVGLTDGPQWASDINACMTIIDAHDHSAGSGVMITPNGINISSDLPFNNNNLTLVRSLRFSSQGAVLTLPTDIGCLYEVGDDLYYNDGLGNNIRITQSGAVAGTPGSISNLVPPASASYSVGTETFIWQADANKPANMDAASYIFRNNVVNSKGLTLAPPNAMGADYTIVLPSLPVSGTRFVMMDSSGNQSAVVDVDNASLEISSSILQVKNHGITQIKKALMSTGQTVGAGGIAQHPTSVTITTTGRPVRLELVQTTTGGSDVVISGAVSEISFSFQFLRDAVAVAEYGFAVDSSFNQRLILGPSLFSFVDIVAAGTYTYTFSFIPGGGQSATLGNISIQAYEI